MLIRFLTTTEAFYYPYTNTMNPPAKTASQKNLNEKKNERKKTN